jgi:hypothetical protein
MEKGNWKMGPTALATERRRSCRYFPLLVVALGLSFAGQSAAAQSQAPDVALFFGATAQSETTAKRALDQIAAAWKDNYAAMILDLLRLMPPAPDSEWPTTFASPGLGHVIGPEDVRGRGRRRLISFLEKRTGQRFGEDFQRWRRWTWTLPYQPHPEYPRFKAELYARIDPRMRAFFPAGARAVIRLDEIEWGGVNVNGIPPLRLPEVVAAGAAKYLKDDHIVFGLYVNGEARAYPKRILAWHEMALDRLGGLDLTIVYCTLCGTVIPYESEVGSVKRTFGTSGLLYRSNKLMFDEETMSLWSTLEGRPVVGKLAGANLRLRAHPVVTTTWGEWRREHPDTTVLSLQTGHRRDYSEGAAYRNYFADDQLMFAVSRDDARLKNKAEVLTLLLEAAGARAGAVQAVAVSAALLRKSRVLRVDAAGRELWIVTSAGGANRVYEMPQAAAAAAAAVPARHPRFRGILSSGEVEDWQGRPWRVTEEALVAAHEPALRLPRVPAQRAFWFGWQAQFPNTILIQ